MSAWASPYAGAPAPWADDARKPEGMTSAEQERVLALARDIFAASTNPQTRTSQFPEDCIIYAMQFEKRARSLGWRP